MFLVDGRISQKIWLPLCLLAVLGSQGIEEKCTAAILDLTVFFLIQLYFRSCYILSRYENNQFSSNKKCIN